MAEPHGSCVFKFEHPKELSKVVALLQAPHHRQLHIHASPENGRALGF